MLQCVFRVLNRPKGDAFQTHRRTKAREAWTNSRETAFATSAACSASSATPRRRGSPTSASTSSSTAARSRAASSPPTAHTTFRTRDGPRLRVFDAETLNRLPGHSAIGHTRYSTAGEVSIREAQPFLVACQHGQVAVCHNGNLPFATDERKELERAGAIFSSTSDTEVILHRIARSQAASVAEAAVEVLRETEGAFSMLFLTPDSLIAVRDPRGFRRSPSAVSATPGSSPPRPAPSTSSTLLMSATWSRAR